MVDSFLLLAFGELALRILAKFIHVLVSQQQESRSANDVCFGITNVSKNFHKHLLMIKTFSAKLCKGDMECDFSHGFSFVKSANSLVDS